MNFYTADSHFGHTNIIKYCKRPFLSVEEMDSVLIDKINAKVGSGDNLYILGDFCFKNINPQKYLDQINCKNVHLIIGNHDSRSHKSLSCFSTANYYLENKEIVNRKDRTVILFHYPIKEWNQWHRGSWHLHGHVHQQHVPDNENYIIDIGVDGHDFLPLSILEIDMLMSKKTWISPYKKWE